MIVFPNAKINIGLQVISRRADGYHNLESLFHPVKINDVLEVVESASLRFTSSGLAIPGRAEDNLCIRAYELMRTDHNLPPVHIHVHKNIPIGAGLGGGSSDAAFFIRLMNEQFALKLTDEQMMAYAAKLGADCVFFIRNVPAVATGIGHDLAPCAIDLSSYFLVVAMPDDHVSTAEAYRGVTPKMPEVALETLLGQKMTHWKASLSNDFEKSVFVHHPAIRGAKAALYEAGALYAAMSGSGAAVFGIFEGETGLPELEKTCRVFYGV
ncbi:MAG: 4-(cytidine 5'-diphospho)-2-C-methyl-D-erythritol kinase [Mucilaginibacter polytrichastri]|nr:4-(cytidine 5'-diphospho)-2-C-methyl-D-erythritol kinase [Mucilaginibacter polytrichastri]